MPESWKQYIHQKLFAPIYDASFPPEYTARGVAVGLLVALTPTVGMQIPMLMVIWPIIHRFFPRWDFNLIAAIAWTFITNIFTLPFFYYLFIVTGRVMLGRWDKLNGFETFEARLSDSLVQQEWYVALYQSVINIIDEFGLPLFVGSLPWAIVGSWLGYRQCLLLIRKRRANSNN